jgi:hypothetical protein
VKHQRAARVGHAARGQLGIEGGAACDAGDRERDGRVAPRRMDLGRALSPERDFALSVE